MCQGAFGLSAGLFYSPQFYAKTEEVIEVAKEAAKRGGIYDTHQRDEASYTIGLMASVAEVLRIGFGTKAVGWDNLVYGVLLVLFIIFLPKGILGSIAERLKWKKA